MTVTARKYNPGFLTDDELVASFCVRMDEFASMIEALRESTGSANTHQIVIGPRGSGKTSLLLRIAAEIRRDAELSARFFPVVFAEESYEVSTAGEFWLECLSRLADQAPRGMNGPDLRHSFEDLRRIEDDHTLGDRCLGALQDFADRDDKRLVLIVENLNMMFGDFADDDAGWRLRQTLQTDPRFLLLASATSRFDEIDDPKQALYDLFRVLTLRPLDTKACAALWRTVSGQDRAVQTIETLRILTGGSPRLLTIVARFGGELSFRELMADLLDLVDDHTEYFKSHLETLAAQERRVYLALADLWKPATTREIAERARLDTSKCSAHLARLTDRGAVEVTGGSARRKLYYLSERLYNIYYLMRRARGPAPMIEALIRFMEGWFSTDKLREFGTRLAREATDVDGETLGIYQIAFEQLVRLPSLETHREDLLSLASAMFADRTDGLSVASKLPTVAKELIGQALTLEKAGRLEDAVGAWDEVVRRLRASTVRSDLEQVSIAMVNKAVALVALERQDEALATWDNILEQFGPSDMEVFGLSVTEALIGKGTALIKMKRLDEALAAWDDVVHRFGMSHDETLRSGAAMALVGKGVVLLALDRLDEALVVYDEVLRRFEEMDAFPYPEFLAIAMNCRATTLARSNRAEEAIIAWSHMVERFGETEAQQFVEHVAVALKHKAIALLQLDRLEEALAVTDEAMQRFGQRDASKKLDSIAEALVNKGWELLTLDRAEEAQKIWAEVERRFETRDSPKMRDMMKVALLGRATIELAKGQPETVIAAADRVLGHGGKGSPEIEWLAHRIRAQVHLRKGDGSACEKDVIAILAILPDFGSTSKDVLNWLSQMAIDMGPEKLRTLIKASPAADLLLPLTTALELELGEEPRVAKEVEEVAEDIRRDMAERRKAKSARSGKSKAVPLP